MNQPFPFFVGCARSGTTLVRAMFDAHPAVAIPPESHFVTAFAADRGRYERGGSFDGAAFVADLTRQRRFKEWQLDPATVTAALAAAAPADYPAAVRATFAAYAREHGKDRYGDKTPYYVMSIAALARLFPEARFVHLIRDGRDVALSLVEQPFGPDTVVAAAATWRLRVRRGQRAGRRLGPRRYRELRYEQLLQDPEQVIRPLCSFLELEFDAVMLRYFERAGELVSTTRASGAHERLHLPPTKGLRDWREQMPAADVRRFESVAGDVLARLGYPLAAPRRRPGPEVLAEWLRNDAHEYVRWARTDTRPAALLRRATHRAPAADRGTDGMSQGEAAETAAFPTLVTVVMPVRNGAATLAEALEALVGQRYKGAWELIVVDNGSTDATVAIAEGFAGRIPGLRIVDASSRPGVPHARNVGAAAARGDFLAFCDADDIASPEWLDAMAGTARNCDLVGGRLETATLNDPEVAFLRPSSEHRLATGRWRFLPFATGANFGIRTEAYRSIGGSDERYPNGPNDVELSWRAQLAGYRACFAEDAVIHYRFRTDLGSIARRGYNYGLHTPLLYQRFKHAGMSRHLGEGLLRWGWVSVHVVDLARGKVPRRQWLARASNAAGRLRGSMRYGTLVL